MIMKMCCSRVILPLFLAFSAPTLTAVVPAQAQQQGSAPFKVGDRVEVDTRLPSIPDEAYYKKATVTGVDIKNGIYIVDVDGPPGQLPLESQILIRDDKPFWIRPIRRGADVPHNVPTEKLHVDQYGTVLTNRPLLRDGFDRKAQNGTPLSPELARKLVQSLIEHPSPPGLDGAVTADIVSLTIGTPRQWIRNQDVGQGSVNTIVYPLHVKWNQKTFYRTRNVLVTGREHTFTCFVDNTHLWQCGYASGPQSDGHTQEIRVVP